MSDKYYDLLKRELRAFADDDHVNGRELLLLYRQANSLRPGRQGRFHKGAFALNWLLRALAGRKAYEDALRDMGIKPKPLVARDRNPRAFRALDEFLDRLASDDKDLHGRLFRDTPELSKSLRRYEKASVFKSLKLAWWSPEDQRWQDRRDSIKNLPSTDVLYEFNRIHQAEPKLPHLIERRWRELRKEDRLSGKAFHFIRDHMRTKDDWIKLRDLQRRFTKTMTELGPVLHRLSEYRLILWDKEKRQVQVNSYDPHNKKQFVWLAASSRPRSPFEPYLEKGKIYQVRDFREYVVDEWVRTGAAEYA